MENNIESMIPKDQNNKTTQWYSTGQLLQLQKTVLCWPFVFGQHAVLFTFFYKGHHLNKPMLINLKKGLLMESSLS